MSGAFVIDLDGVIWLAGQGLPGVDVAISKIRGAGHDVLFATNNSSPTVETLCERLGRVGIDAAEDEVLSSAVAAASAVNPGSRVMVVGDEGLHAAIRDRGLVETTHDPHAVIVGWNRSFDFDTIARTATAIRHGAVFVATNDDPTHPTAEGLLPGTGALIAAIATAAETPPLIAGKPGTIMVDLIRDRAAEVAWVIGDRPSTDGLLAERLGVPFALVRSSATPPTSEPPSLSDESLLAVVDQILAL